MTDKKIEISQRVLDEIKADLEAMVDRIDELLGE